jgi:hypothetical protein
MFGLMLLGLLHTAISLIRPSATQYPSVPSDSRRHRDNHTLAPGSVRVAECRRGWQVVTGVLFIAATLQVRWLRAQRPQQA